MRQKQVACILVSIFLLFDVFNACSSSTKEISTLIWKCQIFAIEKNWRSQNLDFLGKKIRRNALTLKSKKVQGIFGGTFIFALSSSVVFRLQNFASDFFFAWEIKEFYQSSFENEVDFRYIMNVSVNMLARN